MYIMLCLQAIFLYHTGFCVCWRLKVKHCQYFLYCTGFCVYRQFKHCRYLYIVKDYVCIGSLNAASICLLHRIWQFKHCQYLYNIVQDFVRIGSLNTASIYITLYRILCVLAV